MKKYCTFSLCINPKWVCTILLSFISFLSYAGACNCVCCNCDRFITCSRVAAGKKIFLSVKYADTKLLNLKPTAEKLIVAISVAATNSAITITQSDYENIAQNGNSWIDFSGATASFSMNIGTENNSNSQTFTLPSNLLTYFNSYGRLDFIDESLIDEDLQITGSDVVARKMLIDQDENTIYQYYHVDIAPDGVYVLGTSWDMYDEADDNFDEEADYEFLDAPLALNDVFTTIIEEIDYETNVCLTQVEETKTVNGFGTLVLPNGSSVDCLRMSIVLVRRTRTAENIPFNDPSVTSSTTNAIAFISKQGHYFQANVSAVSGIATLTLPAYRFVQVTNTLEETSSVRINNDSKAVSINATDDTAHPSAILDVQSNNKGILIPRVMQANRPANPADGLIIYQIDGTKGLYVYVSGTGWLKLATE